ncbi:hypothetical protein VIGAN_01036000, partial [Vigna angularis var. angularis]
KFFSEIVTSFNLFTVTTGSASSTAFLHAIPKVPFPKTSTEAPSISSKSDVIAVSPSSTHSAHRTIPNLYELPHIR